jgi:undecaprenyl-diphosphatase
MDHALTQWINGPAGVSVLLDSVMIGASRFGVPFLVLLVALQWWSGGDRRHVRHACMAAGFSFFLGLGLNQLILLFVHRVRPYDAGLTHLIINPSADWSFSSDHATATFAIAAAFLLQGLGRRGLALAGGAFVVCVSRVFVGTHYVSDVIGGMATGLIAAVLVRAAYWEGTWADRLVTGIF